MTQKAYCEQQELRYSTFGYWVRKLRRAAEPATEKKGAGFVPVIPATVQAHRPDPEPANGLEIRGIEANNLGLVRDLLGMLA
ncbi:IS66 family insertion sequence element accessory protein TnpA [Thiolapillus sp.]|uniref:IS66 family insertion sequence element accessory protein TnpA n=1 Tax=Thiolapillus sp. TaxID=2017437 RepID=UPI003AF89A43